MSYFIWTNKKLGANFETDSYLKEFYLLMVSSFNLILGYPLFLYLLFLFHNYFRIVLPSYSCIDYCKPFEILSLKNVNESVNK